MNVLLVIVNIAVLILLIVLLGWMQKKHISFTKRVFAGLILGIAYGVVLQWIYTPDSEVISDSMEWFDLVGSGYVGLLQMVVIPLIMVSIIMAILNLSGKQNLGKISGSIIGVLLFTTAIASAIGITVALGFNLTALDIPAGEAEQQRGVILQERLGDVEDMSLPAQLLEFIPTNPFADMTGSRRSSTLAVVIFSAFVGVAALGLIRKNPKQGEMFQNMMGAIYGVVMRMVTIILRLTPYGILALIAKMVATTSGQEILKLINFVVASYVALIAMFVVHLIILAISGLNPVQYVKKIIPTLTFAFTSRSSAATIPMNVETQTKKLGVSEGIANLSASFGATIGQNGCAGIYPSMLAIMIAPMAGINPLDWQFILTLIAVVTISSLGVAGVGGGATFAALIVLSTMNLPVALAGLLISVEPLIDMGRTALNVSGSMTSGVISSKLLKEQNKEVYNQPDRDLDTAEAS
ncbi:L-cystine uptake protein TcyP (sodium:dicarboxylate symporter family) [Paenibacillus sp. SORGH_AS306]|uniref:L-cystine transporter n=1 Tax=unclassified Paenibacillus TaxID=185978 RepID=UPI0023657B25|nr:MULTISPECIES: L-cystine transporter [unclassified Paenibacillus]MDQ1233081.1 L-cystine uptake protein TcyP (sodium:dicarboxylate symporter family) [Paenibacillus sp. SORGH_AS_0306]WDF49809.1 L-cystine transporter [Paenibacillus sp. KACC 21273]